MDMLQLAASAAFFFALGCCIGSFLNVVIWRLPYRGEMVAYGGKSCRLTLSWPPSHCPRCDAPVKWYQNVPIFSWVFLRGRCANCRAGIAVRYPLVEAGTGVLFAGIFLALFAGHWLPGFDVVGENIPATAALVLYWVLGAILLAASAIDADWYIIPGSLTVGLTAVGVIAVTAIDHEAMPTLSVDDPELYQSLARATIGGVIGLALANVLLWRKMIPRSFAQLEEEQLKKGKDAGATPEQPVVSPLPTVTRKWPLLAAAVVIVAAMGVCWRLAGARAASAVTMGGGVLLFLLGVLPRDAGTPDVTQEVVEEISTPAARREIMKELLFVALPILFAVAAMALPIEVTQAAWFRRLMASLLGFLAGGGVVWVVRIGATLGFGKEAMGLGDAHLMAAVGAVIGGPLVVLAFFLAPFLGIVWGVILKIMGKPNVLPYGPWLSIASLASLLFGVEIWCGVNGFMQWLSRAI